MDDLLFDTLARAVATVRTRRGILGAFGGMVAGATVGTEPIGAVRRCRATGVGCTRSSQCCNGICETGRHLPRSRRNRCACVPDCDGNTCGDDGCGGTCGVCGAARFCEDGSCACTLSTCDDNDDCAAKEYCDEGCCRVAPCSGFTDEFNATSPADYCFGRLDGSELLGCDANDWWTEDGCSTDAECVTLLSTEGSIACDDPSITCFCARSKSDGYFELLTPTLCSWVQAVGTCND